MVIHFTGLGLLRLWLAMTPSDTRFFATLENDTLAEGEDFPVLRAA